MRDELHRSSYYPRRMRGWWSARPKAKVWDTNPRALGRPTGLPVEVPTEPPTAAESTPATPPAPGPPPVRALFAPKPGEPTPVEQSPGEQRPVEHGSDALAHSGVPSVPGSPPVHEAIPTVAESSARPAPPFPYAPPAVDSIRPSVPKLTAVPRLDIRPDPSVNPDGPGRPRADFPPGALPQAEFFRLLEVVTSMCDHVIEYIEADRVERQLMVDTLTDISRVITEGAASAVAALAARPALDVGPATRAGGPGTARPSEPWAFAQSSNEPGTPVAWRERVIGGSVAAGPDPHLDLVDAETDLSGTAAQPGESSSPAPTDIAVQVRGRFGDRWVDGFEICEVMTTPAGPRYRLRRQSDGVVLPELFDASNVRYADSFDPTFTPPSEIELQRRERSMGLHPSGSEPGPGPVNGPSGYWSRS